MMCQMPTRLQRDNMSKHAKYDDGKSSWIIFNAPNNQNHKAWTLNSINAITYPIDCPILKLWNVIS